MRDERLAGPRRGEWNMAAMRASVPVGYRRLSFRQAQIAFSDRIMVRSHLVAGRHFRQGYAFLCPPQIAFRLGQPFARRPIMAIPANI
jgi:hypothetical protein